MKTKKLWAICGGVLPVTAAIVIFLLARGGSRPAGEVSGESAVPSASVTTTAGESATSAATATTSSAVIQTAPKATQSPLPAESACRSIGIGGGEFYYAVGFENGDEPMQALVACAVRELEKTDALSAIAKRWFYQKIYPRDTGRDPRGNADSALVASLRKSGVKIGVIGEQASIASFQNGRAVGFEMDVARAAFELYGIQPHFVAVTAQTAAEQLNSGAVDIIWGGLRDGSVAGISYSALNEWNLENEMCYYTLSSASFSGETDLLGKAEKIGVVKDSLCARFLKDRLKTAGFATEITEYATARDAFCAMQSGGVFCVASDYLAVYAMWQNG